MTKIIDVNCTTMLNAYPDSIGGSLSDMITFLKKPELKAVFRNFYVLPSIFNTDLDRGFSVIDYGLNQAFADWDDLKELERLGIHLKLDFVLNHISVLSKQFQDIVKNGEGSEYRDFFINWNKFWDGKGVMTEEGYLQPDPELISNMFFRKPGLPFLMVRMPDGRRVPYWNTFYQEVSYGRLEPQEIMQTLQLQYLTAERITALVNEALDAGVKPSDISFGKYEEYREAIIDYIEAHRKYLGQMDLNIKSPLVWEYYENTLKLLAEYGADIIRLDAFAYAAKEPGEKNFLNDPGTWELLEKLRQIADGYHLTLLPEIHSSYQEKTYEVLADKGYISYDFFLPGLIIDAFESHSGEKLKEWASELQEKGIKVVNMLGCHDGIPLLDLKGLISDEQIERLIDIVVSRGGYVKNLHGQKNIYYQVNATYYSALGEDERKLLLARAIQIFMPGIAQVWYLDLFAGKNDYEAVKKAGASGHKEINRTNLSLEQVEQRMQQPVVTKQLELINFRNNCKAFGFDSTLTAGTDGSRLQFIWENQGYKAILKADLMDYSYQITGIDLGGNVVEVLDGRMA